MKTSKRADAHRPQQIVPADYDFVAFEKLPTSQADPVELALAQQAERKALQAHMTRTGGTMARHEHGGSCMVCGANAYWTIIFYHAKSNRYIRTGTICADKLEMGYGNADIFKSTVNNALAAAAGKRKAEATLTELNLQAVWALYQNGWVNEYTVDAKTGRQTYDKKISLQNKVHDIVGKLVTYGSLSEKQVAFLRTLLDQIANWDAVQVERAAEQEAASPAPTGRVEFDAEVLSTKWVDGYDGSSVMKMLVKATEGYKVWMTVPSAAMDAVERGVKLTVKATLTPSDDDPKFAWGKRPVVSNVEETKN